MDNAGYLALTGRAKDLIITGGHNIDPLHLEELLDSHPAVEQAIVVGQPDAFAGELPVAFVKVRESFEGSIAETDLLDFLRQHKVETVAIPRRVEFIDELPKTAVGKVFRPALRNQLTSYAVSAILEKIDVPYSVEAFYHPKKGQVARIESCGQTQAHTVLAALEKLPVTIEVA